MSTLLIKGLRALVSCDSQDRVYENVSLYARDGVCLLYTSRCV